MSITNAVALFLSLLPRRWFNDAARQFGGILYNLAYAICQVIVDLFDQRALVVLMMRLTTNTNSDIDSWASDFFGPNLLRDPGESDSSYTARIEANLSAKKSVLSGVETVAEHYGTVTIAEPFQVAQMGAIGSPYFACGSPAGGVGSMQPNPQVYITPPSPLDATHSKQAKSTILAARPCGMRIGMFQVSGATATAL